MRLIHPTLLISVALHGVVLFIPTTSSDEQANEADEVVLEVASLPEPPPAESEKNEISRDEVSENRQAAGITQTPSESRFREPVTVSSQEQIPEVSASPTPELSEPLSPVVPPPMPASPESSSTPLEPELPISSSLPFSNFPHLATGEAGCFGLGNCRQINGGDFRQVSADLIEQLRIQDYAVRSRDDLEDSGIKVYEVTKDDVTQYLSVLQPDLGVSVYVLASEPVVVAELRSAEALKAKFEYILQAVSNGEQAQYHHFAHPQFFFEGAVPRSEIGSALYRAINTQPDRLAMLLTEQLANEGFTVELMGEYAGAPFYEISQGAFVAYLSTVITVDSTGTILVGWNRLPEEQ